jgi:hypothetical protein
VGGLAVEVTQLGHPAPDILAGRVELQSLADRVEDPEVRRGVRAAAGDPLPVQRVRREVAVAQRPHEPAGAEPPVHMKVLDQERRDHHSHAVVQEARLGQLPHPGVDQGESGPARTPGVEQFAGFVVLHPLELRPQRLPGGIGVPRQQVRAELPPGKLAPIRVRAGAALAGQVGQHRPRVDLAVLERDRHPRGPVEIGPVSHVVVLCDLLEILLPVLERRLLAGAVRTALRQYVAARLHPLDVRRRSDGLPPPVLQPGTEVRREHLIRPALLVEDPPGRDRVRRSCRHQRTLQ